MDAGWHISDMNSKETFSREAAHIIDLHLNIIYDILIAKLKKSTCNLSEPCQNACEELESNAKCSRLGGYFINVKNTHVCYI